MDRYDETMRVLDQFGMRMAAKTGSKPPPKMTGAQRREAAEAYAKEQNLEAAKKARQNELAWKHGGRPIPPNMAAPDGGFKSRGDFLAAVIRSSGPEARVSADERLRAFHNSMGFAMMPDYQSEILQAVFSQSLAARCSFTPSQAYSLSLPIDELTPWASSLTPVWLDGPVSNTPTTIDQSKPTLQLREYQLKRVAILIPVTDELTEDAPALEAYLDRVAPGKLAFELDYQLLHGIGVHRPLGILNSDCLITVSPGSPAVLDYDALRSMLNSFSGDRSQALWLAHPDLEDDLLDVRDDGGNPAYTFGAGESFGRIFGMPVLPHEVCNASGSVGDLILADFSRYNLVAKSRRKQFSIHLFFDQAVNAFRYLLPTDGGPLLSQPITSRVGSGTRSPFVTLGAR